MTRLRRKVAQIMARQWSDARAPSMRTAAFWAPSTDLIVDEIRAQLEAALEARATWSGDQAAVYRDAAVVVRELLR